MSLKSILVHIDDVAASRPRLEAAIRVARDFRAELGGLYLVPPIELHSTVAAMVPPDVVERRLREVAQAQRDAEQAFRDAAAAADSPRSSGARRRDRRSTPRSHTRVVPTF